MQTRKMIGVYNYRKLLFVVVCMKGKEYLSEDRMKEQ